MNIYIFFLALPVVICSELYYRGTNKNEEPFLPIHSEYSYNPNLMKRGVEEQQEQQPESITQLSPETYASKINSRNLYSATYGQNNYYPYSAFIKSVSSPNTLTTSSYYQTPYVTGNVSPINHLNTYNSPYSSFTTGFGTNAQSYQVVPYTNMGIYPNYYYNQPYYYPNYYSQSTYVPSPPRYFNRSLKYKNDNNNNYNNNYNNNDNSNYNDNDNDNDNRLPEKNNKSENKKNRSRNSDQVSNNNEYVDGNNFIISSSKDLVGESSTHRIPSSYNQIEQDTDIPANTGAQPKTIYQLLKISEQQPSDNYLSRSNSYIKVHQLEQLMRQVLTKLFGKNIVDQANLVRIEQEVNKQQKTKNNHPYITTPNSIAKTGLRYIVNPVILNRINTAQSDMNLNPYVSNELLHTEAIVDANNQSYAQKSATSISLHKSPEVYIPLAKTINDQSSSLEYGDYDSSETVTIKSQHNVESFRVTDDPTHKNYLYSTYRPTQKTNSEEINFGSKQKISEKS